MAKRLSRPEYLRQLKEKKRKDAEYHYEAIGRYKYQNLLNPRALYGWGPDGLSHCKITEYSWHGQMALPPEFVGLYLAAVIIRDRISLQAAAEFMEAVGFLKVHTTT